MQNSVKTKAEEKLALSRKKARQSLNEREKKQQERRNLTAKLRVLRLAKEESDKAAAMLL